MSILLLDYSQQLLVPLPGKRLSTGPPELIGDTPAGAAFTRGQLVEHAQGNGIRVFLPLLDGSDAIGVLAVTHESVDDDDRRLLRRLAGLVANTLVVKSAYTDRLSQARRREPVTVSITRSTTTSWTRWSSTRWGMAWTRR